MGLILIILVAGLIVWLVGHNHDAGHVACKTSELAAPQDSALELLRKRYARGEISKAEFEERKQELA